MQTETVTSTGTRQKSGNLAQESQADLLQKLLDQLKKDNPPVSELPDAKKLPIPNDPVDTPKKTTDKPEEKKTQAAPQISGSVTNSIFNAGQLIQKPQTATAQASGGDPISNMISALGGSSPGGKIGSAIKSASSLLALIGL